MRAGRRQEDVAAAAREWGFDWQRGTVAMLEIGRRRVTAEELVALPAIARDAGLGDQPLGELLVGGSDVMVTLSPDVGIGSLDLQAWGGRAELHRLVTDHAPDMPEAQEIRRLWPRLHPGRRQSRSQVYRIAIESRGDAEIKAARVLGVSPIAVAMAAQYIWNQSLTAQRDAVALSPAFPGGGDSSAKLMVARAVMTARRLQARRGHVTRQLLDDLRPLLKDITKKKRRRG